jgi:hypothetical protein
MKWTENKPPTKGISFYDHTISETPIGKIIIEWKSWKDRPSYDVMIDGEWIGVEYELTAAKDIALNFIKGKSEKLVTFLGTD